ncbi:MAG: Extracellular ligand-binding receptor [Oscillospiraceae bacterium]|nr:Extracellular ligand-binding receptor [Oscillospiraceae bacterium]
MRGKKFFSILLALAMMLTLLSACGGDSADSGSDSTASGSGGDSSDTVKVGVLLPLSGSTAYYGGVQLDGIEFCVNYINNNGGLSSLGGKQIELVTQDSASDPETGVSAFEKLVEEGVVAVIGPYNSTVAAATVPLAIQYQVPYIIVNSTAENFMSTENKYVYRTNTGSTDGDNMWTLIIQYLNQVRSDNPTDKIAIVYDSGDWGTAAVNTWRENAAKMGYEVVVDEAVTESTTDMSTLVNKIKSADTDLVITACFSAATNLLVKQMSEYGCTAKVAGLGGGVGDTEFIENCGDAANGVLYSAPWIPSYGGAGDEATALAEEFNTTYGYEMTMEPCWGWLGMATIINAIEDAGAADREAVADALYQMDVDKSDWSLWFSGYDGVHFATEGQQNSVFGDTGVRYNNNDKLGETDGMVLVQVQDGKWTIVYPTSYNDGADTIQY